MIEINLDEIKILLSDVEKCFKNILVSESKLAELIRNDTPIAIILTFVEHIRKLLPKNDPTVDPVSRENMQAVSINSDGEYVI